ncbi:hypothetical protein [Streptomyces sp. NPDC006638]|uniref:hypothetical protein n=1 Tax=Streptomyces sp. NPDC006638 TaxID=3157183 RepID=UPI0033AC8581
MAKPTHLDDRTRAERALRRAGAAPEQLVAYELALLREVMSHGSISGNASAYVLDRIDQLKELR